MQQNTKSLADYLDIVKRRKYWILSTWFVVSIVSVIIAYNLPKTYRSTATLLIDAPIPTKYLEASVSQLAEEQIQSISQKVTSSENILSIIDAYDLYSDIKNVFPPYELVDFFKGSIEIGLSTSSFSPQIHSGLASVAFDISFLDSDPNKAQEIASELASQFINLNDKTRTEIANKAASFLKEETEKLDAELQQIDNEVAQFKEEHNFSLPEQTKDNRSAIDRAENELRDTESQIRINKERVAFLATELARAQTENPLSVNVKEPTSKDESLRMLKAKYLKLSSIYSPAHPSIIRLKREIQALEPNFEGLPVEDDLEKKLSDAKADLQLLEQTYSDNHPDIIKRKKQIRSLEVQLKSKPLLSGQKNAEGIKDITNPAYIGVEAQYKSSQSELQALTERKNYLITKIENLQNILLQAPQVEKLYSDLIRKRDNIIKKHTQLKEKLLDAKLAQTLEQYQQGQTLTLIEKPIVPRNPEKAIRRKVAIGGFFMGLAAGLGLALILEFLDPGLRGYKAVKEVTGLMPLVVVPYIESPSELNARLIKENRVKKIIMWLSFMFFVTALFIILIFYLQEFKYQN